jgi:hypothetical protein
MGVRFCALAVFGPITLLGGRTLQIADPYRLSARRLCGSWLASDGGSVGDAFFADASSVTVHSVCGVAVVAFSRELILDFAGFSSLNYQRDLFPQSGVDRLVTVSRH